MYCCELYMTYMYVVCSGQEYVRVTQMQNGEHVFKKVVNNFVMSYIHTYIHVHMYIHDIYTYMLKMISELFTVYLNTCRSKILLHVLYVHSHTVHLYKYIYMYVCMCGHMYVCVHETM